MRRLRFFIYALGSIALVMLPFSRSAASSYCPGCKAAVVGAAVGVGAAIGVGIYLVHRSHTSLTGCVQQTENGFSLSTKDRQTYELVNAPTEVKPHTRLSLRGHKMTAASGRAFRVDHVSRDYGGCGV